MLLISSKHLQKYTNTYILLIKTIITKLFNQYMADKRISLFGRVSDVLN